ncbi:Cardiolipin synthase [Frondihabitans sp. 762G35]|uniref:PLD nuclease N-terminal domain-containing protein n=1 Tax=Frondihabitans sp. 762G35 TaxID=1446794 RepID=UPI000D2135CE|nr:PLD nuclease N-terminal domain-containing protein [Frondihabitans sp. 762G35]ARC57936.1 Cardiolipin synthase [Frondihabitans sp. 762G35]
MYLVVSVVSFMLLVVALVDIITRDESQVQHLPKIVWILLVVFLPLVGSVIWFVVGREHGSPIGRFGGAAPRRGNTMPLATTHVEYAAARARTTEQELADLDREIEFYEKQAQLKRLQAEVDGSKDAVE